MAVIEGVVGGLVESGAAASAPQHNTSKPVPYGTLGHYRVATQTGTLAATLAANAVIFSFRWGDATRLCLLKFLRARLMPLTPFTAATLDTHTSLDAYIGRSFTVAHTGGTALTLTGNNAKMRTSMGTSLVSSAGDARISTTAALGGGTITVDAQAFANSLRKGNRVNPAAATEETIQNDDNQLEYIANMGDGDHPLTFAQNEGFVIRNRTVWPAAGTAVVTVELAWAEVTVF